MSKKCCNIFHKTGEIISAFARALPTDLHRFSRAGTLPEPLGRVFLMPETRFQANGGRRGPSDAWPGAAPRRASGERGSVDSTGIKSPGKRSNGVADQKFPTTHGAALQPQSVFQWQVE